jgi:hypothetical protein
MHRQFSIRRSNTIKQWLQLLKLTGLAIIICGTFLSGTRIPKYGQPKLVFVKKIWDAAPHNAFTDLIRYNDYWYCVFREATSHHTLEGNGIIRLIRSHDTAGWETVCTVKDSGFDLRDPKLCITPQGKLMMHFLASQVDPSKLARTGIYIHSEAVFSTDGTTWSQPEKMSLRSDIAWRVTWYNGIAYTVGYNPQAGGCTLYKSRDGIKYKRVFSFPMKGFANEATLLPLGNNRMLVVVRKEEIPNAFFIGTSTCPYKKWEMKEVPGFRGGPNLVMLPDSSIIASYRDFYYNKPSLFLGSVTDQNIANIFRLPSGGDCGYAGMQWFDNALWLSYYSSHENDKASIYLAKVVFEETGSGH